MKRNRIALENNGVAQEGVGGAIAGAVGGLVVAGPLGAVAGGIIGHHVGESASKLVRHMSKEDGAVDPEAKDNEAEAPAVAAAADEAAATDAVADDTAAAPATDAPVDVPATDEPATDDAAAVTDTDTPAVDADATAADATDGAATGDDAAATGTEGDDAPTLAEAKDTIGIDDTDGAAAGEGGEGGEAGEVILDDGEDDTSAFEGDVAALSAEEEDDFEDNDTVNAVMESLQLYAGQLQTLVKTKKGTPDTLALITFGAQQQLNRLHVQMPNVALESADSNIHQQHAQAQMALEGIWENLKQSLVVEWKDQMNRRLDFFKTTEGELKKYEGKLDSALAEYNHTKSSFSKGKVEGGYAGIWPFFSNSEGKVKDISAALSQDLAYSKYMLVTYPSEIIATVKKLTAIIKTSKVDSVEKMAGLVKSVERLPHPLALFDHRTLEALKKNDLLGVVGLEIKDGTKYNVLDIGGYKATKLAEIATSSRIVQKRSFTHGRKEYVGKVGKQLLVGHGVEAALGSMELSADDIGHILMEGRSYLENVRAYRELDKSFGPVGDDFIAATEALSAGFKSMEKADVKVCTQAADQIFDYFLSLQQSLTNPAGQEVGRALKGSKFCVYFGLRMIANATGAGAKEQKEAAKAEKEAAPAEAAK